MKKILYLLFLISNSTFSQELQNLEPKINSSFRGLSVVNDNTAWLGGNNGYIGLTTTGGNNWHFMKIPGYEELDFRTVYAFDDKKAIVANAGSPAYVFVTTDGGYNWEIVFKDERKEVFIDGITFFNEQEGVIFGDPMDKKMFLLRTVNGGKDWMEFPDEERPVMHEGEAAFAASGSTIRSYDGQRLVIASGGSVSRLFVSHDKGRDWKIYSTPIIQGKNSTGIFSFDFIDKKKGIIVGGDYSLDTLKTDHIFLTNDGGKSWFMPTVKTGGYRSCVEYIDSHLLIATGTSGTEISRDGGKNWEVLTSNGFHVIGKARTGKLLILAGSEGRIAVFK